MKNTERKSSVLKDRKFGYEAKAIFYPLTSGKDYATIARTKGKNRRTIFSFPLKKVDGGGYYVILAIKLVISS